MLRHKHKMSGRLKRNANAKPSRVSGALADLLAAREGGAAKRAAAFEVKEEEAVYDEVDEEQYEQLASKRRIETGEDAGWPKHRHQHWAAANCKSHTSWCMCLADASTQCSSCNGTPKTSTTVP